MYKQKEDTHKYAFKYKLQNLMTSAVYPKKNPYISKVVYMVGHNLFDN